MIISPQACSNPYTLPKSTLLAMLKTNPDYSKAVVATTGEVIDISGISKNVIQTNINKKVWVYYEQLLPRKMLVLNPNWVINSFDPFSRNVCVSIFANSGTTVLNFTLDPLTPS